MNQREPNSALAERTGVDTQHQRRKLRAALLEEEREVRDDRAAQREQDAELDHVLAKYVEGPKPFYWSTIGAKTRRL